MGADCSLILLGFKFSSIFGKFSVLGVIYVLMRNTHLYYHYPPGVSKVLHRSIYFGLVLAPKINKNKTTETTETTETTTKNSEYGHFHIMNYRYLCFLKLERNTGGFRRGEARQHTIRKILVKTSFPEVPDSLYQPSC